MFTFTPIGFIESPYRESTEIPKGLAAKHDAEGLLKVLPEFEPGLVDIEGFSHLFVLWVFDRSTGFDLTACPPSDNRIHGVFATRSPRRPNPMGLPWCNCSAEKGQVSACAGWTCSTAPRFSTSSRICPVSLRRH